MKRSFLQTVCRTLIGVVLLAQMSIAAYACPMLSAAMNGGSETAASATADAADTATMNCEQMAGAMDASLPNLCAAHCHQGEQSDQASTLAVPVVVLTALYLTPLAPVPVAAARSMAAASSALAAAFPPHALLHCCLRI